LDGDYFGRNRNFGGGQNELVKFELQPALARQASRLAVIAEAPHEVGTAREHRPSELPQRGQMAAQRIADLSGLRGKSWLVQRALDERSSVKLDLLGAK